MSRTKTFLSFVLPSLLAFALSGVYAIVDGFFIGNSLGDVGLSTINIAYPVVSLLQALGTGLGMGGAVLYTVHLAGGNPDRAEDDAKGTITLLLIVSIIVSVVLFVMMTPVLQLLGAKGDLLILGKKYLQVIIIGGIFQIFGTGIVPLIRNNGGATFAMVSMVSGFLTNIVLDFLLVWVFPLGMFGAALATIVAQAVTALLGIGFLMRKKLPILGIPQEGLFSLMKASVKIGVAPFGLTISPIISLVFMNRVSLVYGGSEAVAAYACIAYAITIVYLLLQGVGDGTQPLISREYGKGDYKELAAYQRMVYIAAEILAAVCIIVLFLFRNNIAILFGASATVKEIVANALPIFLLGVPFLGMARVITSNFYATEKNVLSYMVVFAEPIMLIIIIFILPLSMGQNGVWLSMSLAQIAAATLGVGLKYWSKRNEIKQTTQISDNTQI